MLHINKIVLSLLAAMSVGCATSPTLDGKALTLIGKNIYVDPAYDASEHAALEAMIARAKKRTADFYGGLQSTDPDMILCKSHNCSVYFSGTEKRGRVISPGRRGTGGGYLAPRMTIVITSLGRIAELHLAHELSHVEFTARLGNMRVPHWFNEGVAMHMSGQFEFERCANMRSGVDNLRKLDAGWEAYTNDRSRMSQTYCQAAREIRMWVEKNGKPALLKLLDDVKWGKSFDSLYGPLLSQPR